MKQRALLLVNPHARKGREAQMQAVGQLQALGFESIQESAENPQYLPEIIRQYRHMVDLVIISSGDGTVNAAIEGLLDTQLPLGILPSGTANNLARSLKIPPSLPEACKIVAAGKIRRIDLGWVNGKYFFNVAGLGLSAQINRRVPKAWKRRWGVLAYAAVALQILWQSRPFEAEIRWNNRSTQVKTFQITVCNGRYYGSGLVVAEDAAIDDQRLDLYSVKTQQWWELLALLPAIVQGKKVPGVLTLQGKEINIYTKEPAWIDTDGELTTTTPAQFRVIPQALPVFVPVER
ncbi:MAG TPA: lipid kinase [Cyanobacteria bacterium UBA11372]|nr:lipid kinase [Cyanobacteria bacterium UBA11372]HBE30095.1 lipid kinase [Cyanobacteria bacterium UBA11368]